MPNALLIGLGIKNLKERWGRKLLWILQWDQESEDQTLIWCWLDLYVPAAIDDMLADGHVSLRCLLQDESEDFKWVSRCFSYTSTHESWFGLNVAVENCSQGITWCTRHIEHDCIPCLADLQIFWSYFLLKHTLVTLVCSCKISIDCQIMITAAHHPPCFGSKGQTAHTKLVISLDSNW